MRRLLFAILFTAAAAPAIAADKPKEYSEAFCAGWNAAVGVEQGRRDAWTRTITAAIDATDPQKMTENARTVQSIVASAQVMVWMSPLQTKVQVNGDTIDCTPPAPPEPAKDAPAPTENK